MVKVVNKKGKVLEVPEIMFSKQGANMGWTLIESDIAETPTVQPTDETLKFIESQKAAIQTPEVETVCTDECKETCTENKVCEQPEQPIVEQVKPAAKPTAKRKPRTKKTTK